MITLVHPEGKETLIWPKQPKPVHSFKMHLYPELSPPTEEEKALISVGLSPPPKKSLVKKVSTEFRKVLPMAVLRVFD
jgi:hypothetical protein